MLTQLTSFIRNRWHPLWRLRQSRAFRRFQRRWDCSVYTQIPETDLRVAVKLMRDANWIFSPASLEPSIRTAFALVLDLTKPTIFWDIGANIGFYSWFVRRFPSIQQVVMFEPDPTNFALITRTIHKNAISDCKAINAALSDISGEAPFLVDSASGATGSLETVSERKNKHSLHHVYQMDETIICRTMTVDGLIAEGVPQPDLMKIDVEGAEHLVLNGAEMLVSRHRPTMIIETSNTELVRRLFITGYTVFRIDDTNLLFIADTDGLDLAPLNGAFSRYDAVA